jgi:hypothetical protein
VNLSPSLYWFNFVFWWWNCFWLWSCIGKIVAVGIVHVERTEVVKVVGQWRACVCTVMSFGDPKTQKCLSLFASQEGLCFTELATNVAIIRKCSALWSVTNVCIIFLIQFIPHKVYQFPLRWPLGWWCIGKWSWFIVNIIRNIWMVKLVVHSVTCMSDSQWDVLIGDWIYWHFNIRLVTTFNYSVIGNFHTSQIIRAHAKYFPACSVFTSSCLVTVSTMPIPLLSCQALSEWRLLSNWLSRSYFTTGAIRPVRLKPSPLRLMTRVYFQLNRRGHSPGTSSRMRRWVCIVSICLAFRQVYVSHITSFKMLPFVLHTIPLSVKVSQSRSRLS